MFYIQSNSANSPKAVCWNLQQSHLESCLQAQSQESWGLGEAILKERKEENLRKKEEVKGKREYGGGGCGGKEEWTWLLSLNWNTKVWKVKYELLLKSCIEILMMVWVTSVRVKLKRLRPETASISVHCLDLHAVTEMFIDKEISKNILVWNDNSASIVYWAREERSTLSLAPIHSA